MRENTDQKKNRYLDTFYAVTNLATTGALTAVENKMPSVSNLILVQKKTDYNTKINKIEKKITDHNHNKYVTTPVFKVGLSPSNNFYDICLIESPLQW